MKLSTTQAAERLGVTTVTLGRWIASGKISARKVGGRWLVDASALDGLKRGKPGRRPAERATIARSSKGSKLHAVRKGVSLCGMRCEWVGAKGKPNCKRCAERLK